MKMKPLLYLACKFCGWKGDAESNKLFLVLVRLSTSFQHIVICYECTAKIIKVKENIKKLLQKCLMGVGVGIHEKVNLDVIQEKIQEDNQCLSTELFLIYWNQQDFILRQKFYPIISLHTPEKSTVIALKPDYTCLLR